MKDQDLNSMSVDELWALHEQISSLLSRKLEAEKAELNQRLIQLGAQGHPPKTKNRTRRPYPQVVPKYRNPAQPAETWAGRGKQPRWLTALLKAGKKLDDFSIQESRSRTRRRAAGS
jgi:DNA-binding protein H-NS